MVVVPVAAATNAVVAIFVLMSLGDCVTAVLVPFRATVALVVNPPELETASWLPDPAVNPAENPCVPVQVFALPTFNCATTAPVDGDMVNELFPADTEATAPPPPL